MNTDVLFVLLSVGCGCWRVAGAGGKSERPWGAGVSPCTGGPLQKQLGELGCPGPCGQSTTRCWDVWGEQAWNLHSPGASKCLYLQHLQAWLLLRIMEKIPLFSMS